MARVRLPVIFVFALASGTSAMCQPGDEGKAANVPGFEPANISGEYRIETGTLSGLIRNGGRSEGLAPLQYVPTGTALANPPGLFNYYRVFTTNRRYGESARGVPSEARGLPDGGLEVRWAASEGHPYELAGVYRWRDSTTLDLDTEVNAHEELPDFEVFLASYCSERFPATAVYVKRDGGDKAAGFVVAEEAYGKWQACPRDQRARDIILDGRWSIPPNPVEWSMMPEMAAPLAFRRNLESRVSVAVMAPAEDCFAVFTPCRGDSHYSMYLSLFGKTIKAGETARARARLVVGSGLTDDQILASYTGYLAEMDQKGQQ